VKAAAKAAARTRKGAQPSKATQVSQAGKSARRAAKGATPATPTSMPPTDSMTADGGPDRTER
jgi:hypothetical protein